MTDPKELDEAMECLIKADEIKNNKELMKQLEPKLKEQQVRITKMLDAKDMWKQAYNKAVETEYKEKEEKKELSLKKYKEQEETAEEETVKHKGERVLKEEEDAISSKD